MRRLFSLLAPAFAALVTFAAPAQAEQTTVLTNPLHKGLPISVCAAGTRGCTQQDEADAACVDNGYERTTGWYVRYVPRAIALDTGRICEGSQCLALQNVNCVRSDGYRADRRKQDRDDRKAERRAEREARKDEREQRRLERQRKSETYTTSKGIVFTYPKIAGVAVDNCKTWGNNCGRPAATQFCERMGYGKAVEYDRYDTRPTYVIGSDRICDKDKCRAFSSVTCAPAEVAVTRDVYGKGNSRTYSYPQVSGLYIDHCETFGKNCGRGGAEQFCRSQGFSGASAWDEFNAGSTYVIGSNRACQSGRCTGFSSVTCTNGVASPYREPALVPFAPAQRAQTFQYPTVRGAAVDHCTTNGQNCGRQAADQFCRVAGFAEADRWDTFDTNRTYVIGSDRYCEGGRCRAFSSVSCVGTGSYTPAAQPRYNDTPRYSEPVQPAEPARTGEIRRFAFPQMNGLSIDKCAREGRRCERGGANRFCKSQGFIEAVSWNTYRAGTTWYIGGERQCSGNRCEGLTDLICER